MRKLLIPFSIILFLVLVILLGLWKGKGDQSSLLPLPKERLLDIYTIENLSRYVPQTTPIKFERVLKEDKNFTSHLFFFSFNPNPASSQSKKVGGLINIPKGEGPFPAILMLRGYVDQKSYKTGDGTRRVGEFFANNGFLTIAPDFLGYGESDQEAGNIFEARFQTYTTVLALLNSLNSLNSWDKTNIFLWGHSNGGQIALTILEITSANYPTTLWAPVSKPFPYSILYYTDESDDKGKLIRSELAKFEKLYDTDLYSIHQYYDKIKTPVQLHQGTADDAVPKTWSDELSRTILGLDLNLNYFIYSGADHNLNPSWDLVIRRDLTFFNKHLKL